MQVKVKRREFLAGAFAAAGLAAAGRASAEDAPQRSAGRILFGACRRDPKEIQLMKSIGYDFWEASVDFAFDPGRDGEWWKRRRDELAAYALPLRSCNGFIPGKFRLTGPQADHAAALDYAETALRRADEAGVKTIVFGSGGARNVPGDYCGKKRPDVEKGARQYEDFCRKLAERCADLKTTCVVLEPLRPNESNIVNFVWQGAQIVRDVASPRIRLLADIFHMMMGREPAASIATNGNLLKHCHIAEYGTRAFPGANPRETHRLAPYFDALKSVGYTGGVSCECSFGKRADLAKNLETALKTMKGLS